MKWRAHSTRLTIPGAEKPFHIQYQLLDIDARTITTSFGALLSSTKTRSRFMLATIRVGDYPPRQFEFRER